MSWPDQRLAAVADRLDHVGTGAGVEDSTAVMPTPRRPTGRTESDVRRDHRCAS